MRKADVGPDHVVAALDARMLEHRVDGRRLGVDATSPEADVAGGSADLDLGWRDD